MGAQVVQGFDVTEIGWSGELPAEHADLLALVDEGCAALQEIRGREGGRRLEPGVLGIPEARHRPRLVVIFQVQGVPATLAQGLLPASQYVGQLAVSQGTRGKLPVLLTEVHVLELDEHVELAPGRITEQEGRLGGGIRSLADRERAGVERERALVHLLEELVQARAISEALVTDTEGSTGGASIGQTRALGDNVDCVDAEAVDTAIKPPVHHVVDRVAHLRVFPVQIRLLAGEQVKVVLARGWIVLPGRATEERLPVRRLCARRARFEAWAWITPVVPVAARGLAPGCRFNEPRVLDRRVVDDQIHHHAHTQLVGARNEGVKGCQVAKQRVDVAVVGDVVAVVGLRRAIDGGDPDDVDPEARQVLEATVDTVEISDPVAVRVLERAGVHLVEDRVLPPRVGIDTSGRQKIRAQEHGILRRQ